MKASLLFPLLAAAYVSAHGFVATITIDGTAYQGNPPRFGSPPSDNPSIVRQIATNGPINGASDPSMSCGIESLLASRVADANPGSQVIFDWKAGGGQNVRFFLPHSYFLPVYLLHTVAARHRSDAHVHGLMR